MWKIKEVRQFGSVWTVKKNDRHAGATLIARYSATVHLTIASVNNPSGPLNVIGVFSYDAQ